MLEHMAHEKMLRYNESFNKSKISWNSGLIYSVPLTEEDIFAQVMAVVNRQLQRTMRMPTRKRKSLGQTVIRKLIGKSLNSRSRVCIFFIDF